MCPYRDKGRLICRCELRRIGRKGKMAPVAERRPPKRTTGPRNGDGSPVVGLTGPRKSVLAVAS